MGNKNGQGIYVEGFLFGSLRDAAKYIGCSNSAIFDALFTRRYCVKRFRVWPQTMNEDYIDFIYGKDGKRIKIDDIVYKSISSAAKDLKVEKNRVKLSIDMGWKIKGHTVQYIEEKEYGRLLKMGRTEKESKYVEREKPVTLRAIFNNSSKRA
jgi:hypothetical protein